MKWLECKLNHYNGIQYLETQSRSIKIVQLHSFRNAKHYTNCLVKHVAVAVFCCAAAVATLVVTSPENMMDSSPWTPQSLLSFLCGPPCGPAGPIPQGNYSSFRALSAFSQPWVSVGHMDECGTVALWSQSGLGFSGSWHSPGGYMMSPSCPTVSLQHWPFPWVRALDMPVILQVKSGGRKGGARLWGVFWYAK